MYWIIAAEGRIEIERAPRWQEPCLRMFGLINRDMRIKCLGLAAPTTAAIETGVADPGGWFGPCIPDGGLLGCTMVASKALGPEEVVAAIKVVMNDLRRCTERVTAESVYAAAEAYLPYLPFTIADAFRRHYKLFLVGLPH